MFNTFRRNRANRRLEAALAAEDWEAAAGAAKAKMALEDTPFEGLLGLAQAAVGMGENEPAFDQAAMVFTASILGNVDDADDLERRAMALLQQASAEDALVPAIAAEALARPLSKDSPLTLKLPEKDIKQLALLALDHLQDPAVTPSVRLRRMTTFCWAAIERKHLALAHELVMPLVEEAKVALADEPDEVVCEVLCSILCVTAARSAVINMDAADLAAGVVPTLPLDDDQRAELMIAAADLYRRFLPEHAERPVTVAQLASNLLDAGRLEEAEAAGREAVELIAATGDELLLARAKEKLARILATQVGGMHPVAYDLAQEAVATSEQFMPDETAIMVNAKASGLIEQMVQAMQAGLPDDDGEGGPHAIFIPFDAIEDDDSAEA